MFPNKVNNKWPAIILAHKRIANVPGRIIFLIISIQTINDIRVGGVPWGTRWINIWFEFFNQPKSINENHRGNAKVNVMTIWLELVKIYGKSPRKLLFRIKMNNEINSKVNPLNFDIIRIFNSL